MPRYFLMDDGEPNRDDENSYREDNQTIQRLYDRLVQEAQNPRFWLEIIALIGLALYTVAAYWQLGVMSDTLKLERPWIGPTARTFIPRPDQGHLVALGWHYQNGGRTVATRIRNNLEFMIGPPIADPHTAPVSEECRKGELAKEEGNIAIPGSDKRVSRS